MMNRHLKKLVDVPLSFAALLLSGCATTTPAPAGPAAVLVVVHIPGGGAPSAQQVTKVYEAIAPGMTRAGLQIARSVAQADYLLTATFTPDPGNPSEGHVTVNSIERARRALGGTADVFPSRAAQQEALQELNNWAVSHSGPDR